MKTGKIFKILLMMLIISLIGVQSKSQSFYWAHHFGGTANETGYRTAVDGDQNVVLSGLFGSSYDADPGPGVAILNPVGVNDIFIQKLDSAGNLLWAGSIGCVGYSLEIHDVKIDNNDTIFVCGAFYGGGDFDPGQGVFNLPAGGGLKAFFMKLDPSGNLVWVKYIGTGFITNAKSIDTDENGFVYVTGHFSGFLDLDPDTTATTYVSSGNGEDFYLIKLDADGDFIWGFAIGGSSVGISEYLVYKNGKLYITGFYSRDVDFDPGSGVTTLPGSIANENLFVACYDTSGVLVSANGLNEPENDRALKIDVDPSGNVFITGYFSGPTDFDPTAGTTVLNSVGYDGFIASYNNTWQLRWAHGFGSNILLNSHQDIGRSVKLSDSGNVFFTGNFKDTVDFDPGPGVIQLIADSVNTFLCSYTNSGNFRWIKGYKGLSAELGLDVSISNDEQLYFTGSFAGTMTADSAASVSLISNGGNDAFLIRYADVVNGLNELNTPFGKVSVFPNPSQGSLYFTDFDPSQIYTISVFDLAGKLLKSTKTKGESGFLMNLDVSSGVYTIRIDTSLEFFVTRIQIIN